MMYMALGTLLMTDKKNSPGPEASLQEHESGVRRMVADKRGETYQALASLEEAKAVPDGVVVFEGDDGGQLYLTCPASMVICSSEVLATLVGVGPPRDWVMEERHS